MARVDFGATLKQAEADGLVSGGGFYKYREGDNRIRLMSECVAYRSEYKGEPSFKWLCYIIDRRDGRVKAHMMPHRIYKAIAALQTDPDYAFTEVPMPYDINVKATKAGTKEVEYAVVPSPRQVPITADEDRDLHKQKPLEELKQALKDKQGKDAEPPAQEPPHPAGNPDLTDEAIPF